jgi:hypothetical protein
MEETMPMKSYLLLAAAALALAACSPKPAADPTQAATGAAPAGAPDASQMRAQIQAQMAQQQAQMSSNTAGCVTTRDANNNVTTQCP